MVTQNFIKLYVLSTTSRGDYFFLFNKKMRRFDSEMIQKCIDYLDIQLKQN